MCGLGGRSRSFDARISTNPLHLLPTHLNLATSHFTFKSLHTMSSPDLSSFNPHGAEYSFMLGGTPPQQSPSQSPMQEHDRRLPASGAQSLSQSPATSPLSAPKPIHAPVPTPASRQVFERYDRGCLTPDLVLRGPINNWGAQPLSR